MSTDFAKALESQHVLVVDFGAQYAQLIARRVRECKVYSEIVPSSITADEISLRKPAGIILSGGPASVHAEHSPLLDEKIYDLGIPILGICYGAQLLAHQLPGGSVANTGKGEYGRTSVTVTEDSLLLGSEERFDSWMSHFDSIETPPKGAEVVATTSHVPVAAFEDRERARFGVQFHPEVAHTKGGKEVLERFLYHACGCAATWTVQSLIDTEVPAIAERIGTERVLCALSGGVDSSVAAALVHRAVGEQLTCVFVDTGLMRKNEAANVEATFRGRFGDNFVHVKAADRFLTALAGITDPEAKRKVIGETFIRVFEDEARKLGAVPFLVQGTLYPDVVESGGSENTSTIKSHHNVGGLPDDMTFQLVEPLRALFKDEVRAIGVELGLPDELVWRQPFPGPGLGVRIIGEVTPDKVAILQEADAIVLEEIHSAGLYREIWQSFAVLPDIRSVGVMGDERTYGHPIIVRAVTSDDAMTADWARLPYDVLETISSRIINEVQGVNRVALDITSKPPGTIEWE